VKTDDLLRLLLIEASRNDAETLVGKLRGSGMAVRAVIAEDEAGLLAALDGHAFDVVLVAVRHTGLPPDKVLGCLHARGLDMPLIALGDVDDPVQQVTYMLDGCRDVVRRDAYDHIGLVLEREREAYTDRCALREARKAAHESEKRCRALIDSSRDAITYVHQGMHVYANSVYLNLFGFSDQEEIEGTPIMDMVAPEEHTRLKEFLRGFGREDHREDRLQVRGQRPDGGFFDAEMEFAPASIGGESCIQIIIRDRVDNGDLEKQIHHLSKQDLLTGLYNRQFFLDQLSHSDAAGTHGGSLLYLLVDDFLSIKNRIGIAAGDLVMRDVAEIVNAHLGEAGIAARFSDHVFTILMHTGDAAAMADALRAAVAEHVCDAAGQAVSVTLSIGICPLVPGLDAQRVLGLADSACEVARAQGGNRVHREVPALEQHQIADGEWPAFIQDALSANRFRLVFQPIVSLQNIPGEKYEVLLRLMGDDGALSLPDALFTQAASAGLGAHMDRWVIEHAIQVLSEQRRISGAQTVFFVKLTEQSLGDDTLLPWLAERLRVARLTADSLCFEISEQTAVARFNEAKRFSNSVRELRGQFCIEHFGLRDNSLHLLKYLAADYIKLEATLTRKLAESAELQAQVRSLAQAAQEHAVSTIAAYIEDASSVSALWQCGVRFVQGNFLQEPHPLLDFEFTEEIA
jgi:diguanylate cyclase (GGDEF)-like protein/PAS domain S-box-containing protein